MNAHTFPGLKRVSKAKARRLWGNGSTISLCPCNLRPDGAWRPNVDFFPEEQRELAFDQAVREFDWFNCQSRETGYYAAFYVRNPEVTP